MAFTRWVGWVRDVVRVLRGVSGEEIRQETLAMHEQLIRLRRHRAAYEKEREIAALSDIRKIVEEMKNLETSLNDAEKATTDYVDTIAKKVTIEMEAKITQEMNEVISRLQGESIDLGNHASTKSVGTVLESLAKESKQLSTSTGDGGPVAAQISLPYEPPTSAKGG